MDSDPRMDDYLLGLTGKSRPRVCFVPTASGDSKPYIARFYSAFTAKACEPTHLALFSRTAASPREQLLTQDLIYVGGGNTANMLAVWRTQAVDVALREAWERGIILCGISAGGMCWFQGGVTDSFGPTLAPWPMGWRCSRAASVLTTAESPSAEPPTTRLSQARTSEAMESATAPRFTSWTPN